MSRIRLSLASSAGTALILVLALGTMPAQAQFVCVGNANGATVPPATASGAGATAAGSANNFACGTNANASGTTSTNTATGNAANASGRSTVACDTTAGFFISVTHRTAGTTIPVYFSGSYGTGGVREQVGRVGFAWEW